MVPFWLRQDDRLATPRLGWVFAEGYALQTSRGLFPFWLRQDHRLAVPRLGWGVLRRAAPSTPPDGSQLTEHALIVMDALTAKFGAVAKE